MNRETLLKELKPLSPMEEKWQEGFLAGGNLHENNPGSLSGGHDGVRVLGNALMRERSSTENPDKTWEDPLHRPLRDPALGDRLRLIIHQRFQRITPHFTEFVSVDYVLRGSLVIGSPDMRDVHLHAGQLCLMNAGLVHSYEIRSAEDLILNVQIEKEFLNRDLLSDLRGTGPAADFLIRTMLGQTTDFTYLIAGFEGDERMEGLMEDLFCEFLEPGAVSDIYVKNLMRTFVTLLIRSTSSVLSTGSRADILSILGDIERNPEHCTLTGLAEKYHFSAKYLGNLIKRQTGENFQTLLEESRMKKAEFLLRSSEDPIYEIAAACGYSNLSFFYQRFQKRHGCLPAQYRQEKREGTYNPNI